jgi:hypothetical protein
MEKDSLDVNVKSVNPPEERIEWKTSKLGEIWNLKADSQIDLRFVEMNQRNKLKTSRRLITDIMGRIH